MDAGIPGTVLVSYGSHGIARLDDGRRVACQYRRSVGRPFCGDRVHIIDPDQGSATIETILPRRNRFVRADKAQRQHVIAANLDRVLIVLAHKPLPSRDLLERYLVAVHSLDIEPVIVINKVDIADIDSTEPGAAVVQRIEAYQDLGYQLARTSCKTGPGVQALQPLLKDKTGILVGQSGVGKSSLVNQLLPDIEVQTRELSGATGKGTHTTTTTKMYSLPSGGFLIDSPGVWEYGLWKLEDSEIARGFIEFRPWLGKCRFTDCKHDSEPECAVKTACRDGKIQAWRHQSYLRLLSQNR